MPVPPPDKLNERIGVAFFGSDEYIKLIKAECEKAIPVIIAQPASIINTFITCMLERLHAGILCIDPLYSHYLGEARIQFGLGILLRALHLDYLIMLNVLEIMKRNGNDAEKLMQETEEFCLVKLSDSAKHMSNLFKNGNMSPDMRKQLYTDLVKKHTECFHPYNGDGSEPILLVKKSYSPSQLIHKLRNSSMPWLANKDHAYNFYSKYDHFGKLFHTISKSDFTREFVHLGEAIRELPRSLAIILTLAVISTAGDQTIVDIATRVAKHCEAIDAQEKKEKEESKAAAQKSK